MCDCVGMARTFDEMQGAMKSFPPSKHHPACEDYELLTYARITYDGGSYSYITEPKKVDEFIRLEVESGNDAADYEVTELQLTVDQYETLPEFDGF